MSVPGLIAGESALQGGKWLDVPRRVEPHRLAAGRCLPSRRSGQAPMKDAFQLVWVAAGAVIGGLVGFLAFIAGFVITGQQKEATGVATILLCIGLCGGGILLGGYISMLIVNRRRRPGA